MNRISTHQPGILLADDHGIVLEGFLQLLKDKFRILGIVSKGQEVLPAACRLKPDCVLLDISMGEANGFIIARQLKHTLPHTKIIFVTMHAEPTFVKEAFLIGVDGYVLKHNAASELLVAINRVLCHRRYLSTHLPDDVRKIVQDAAEGLPTHELSGSLTERQQHVLGLLAKGYSSKKVAETLGITLRTVAFHKANIMRSLGLRTAAELTKYAIAEGLVSLKSKADS